MHLNLIELVFSWSGTCLAYLAAQKQPGSLPKLNRSDQLSFYEGIILQKLEEYLKIDMF